MYISIGSEIIEILSINYVSSDFVYVSILDSELQKTDNITFSLLLEKLILYLSEPKYEGIRHCIIESEDCFGYYYFKYLYQYFHTRKTKNISVLVYESNSFYYTKIYYICG